MSAIDKRMYYLMLSPSEGQDFANKVGFSKPSEDVQEAETYDIISRWSLLASAGVLEDAIETSDWLMEIEGFIDIPESLQDNFKRLLIAHNLAFINKLLDSDKAALLMLTEVVDE